MLDFVFFTVEHQTDNPPFCKGLDQHWDVMGRRISFTNYAKEGKPTKALPGDVLIASCPRKERAEIIARRLEDVEGI